MPSRTGWRSRQELKRDVPLDDPAMISYARELAQSLRVEARARLNKRDIQPAQMRRLSEEAQRLSQDTPRTSAMDWLLDNARVVEANMQALVDEKSEKLPAHEGEPRIQILMRELVQHGDAQVDKNRLMGVLKAFDEVTPFTMDELWVVPAALRIELCAAFSKVSEQVLAQQRDRANAEEWVRLGASPSMIKSQRHSSAFYEHALMLMHEQEMPKARRMLEEYLERHEAGADSAIQLAHAEQALTRLMLSNAMGSLRMLDALIWLPCFEQLSGTEKLLFSDPAGVYPAMDEESRSAVRDQVKDIARATELSEYTVARHAVQSAKDQEGAKNSVCWWLYDDEGREELLRALDAEGTLLVKLTPDPKGAMYMSFLTLIALAFFALVQAMTGNLLFALVSLPLCVGYAQAIINRVCMKMVKPHPLLKMDYQAVPDALRTLIVIPALLSSKERAVDVLTQLEALGHQQPDANVDLLLLGDFKDSPSPEDESDAEIRSHVKGEIARINARAGREQFFYLNRARVFSETQGTFMGKERKRGALMALNHLLLTGESEFDAEGECADRLKNRNYTYVVTLDAGTQMLPGTLIKLVGAISHPLNRPRQTERGRRGYAVLQPRMDQACFARQTRFARLLGGMCGVDSYPCCASEVYQDLTGQGVFGGKGIYDLRAFHEALHDRLPDGAILSHDLLEGLIARSGSLGDVALYDEFPKNPSGYFSRMNRWTRGDWQLIPFIRKDMGLTQFDRFLMIDNLIRSLEPVAAIALLLMGMWVNLSSAVVFALAFTFVPALLRLPKIDRQSWISSGLRLSLLPIEAYQQLDAILRTLHRLYISRKNLLSWVTAADAEKSRAGASLSAPGRIVSFLLLPAILHPDLLTLAIGLWMLFLTPGLQLQDEDDSYRLSEPDRAMLHELAKDTWGFFESQVAVSGNGLPPDNVQVSPPVGAARRTSPTNIGLYLCSCLAAWQLGFLARDQMLKRMARTVDTMESLPKWNGQLFNWYDIDSLLPLPPRYVSSVDSGNLAACLLACAAALSGASGSSDASGADADDASRELASRMDELANGMRLDALFDDSRKLFVIGADVERDQLSESHYDLLASESRILSFVAMALHQAPVKHWARLGRALTGGKKGQALISWSGTMFEYLMPELLIQSPAHSLLGATNRRVVQVQIAKGGGFPWGVSECGYNAFDLSMNYQYRAFGLPELALCGEPYERVIAPYASVLALPFAPKAVISNIRRMKAMGFAGEFGLYEAIDCAPARMADGEQYHVVKSFMAHHQGMILCALLNALNQNYLSNCFMGRPELRALSLMLCEKPPVGAPMMKRRRANAIKPEPRASRLQRTQRKADPLSPLPDTQILYGGGGTRLLSADGRGFFRVNGVMLNRWQLSSNAEDDGLFVHVRPIGRGVPFIANGWKEPNRRLTRRASFDAGSASFITRVDDLEVRFTECVSPEDGALVQQMVLISRGASPIKLEITGCFAVALCAQVDMQAHPVFQNLFVESATAGESALVFRRRPKDERRLPLLVHTLFGAKEEQISRETDLGLLMGRDGSLGKPGGIAKKLSGSVGRVLNPCSALRVKLVLAPGERRELGFAIGMAKDEDAAKTMIKRYQQQGAARRAQTLSQTQARAMLEFLNMSALRYHSLQRAAAFLHWPKLRFLQNEPPVGCSISGLWALGVSGELPIISVFVKSKEQLELAREAVRAHEFYRALGVWCHLLLINDYGNNYEQPVRDALRELMVSSHLRELQNEPGGAMLLEGATLTDTQRALIRSLSSIALFGGEGTMNAQLVRRFAAEPARPEAKKRFPPSGRALKPRALLSGNGYGGFSADGREYVINLTPGKPTPAPWCNLLANPSFGTLVTERGGGFTWHGSSRFGRLTAFDNDVLKEGFTERIHLAEGDREIPLLPELGQPGIHFRVTHSQGVSRFESNAEEIHWTVHVFVDAERPVKCYWIELANAGETPRGVRLSAEIDFLMGVSLEDARLTRVTKEGDIQFARGAMGGVGFAQLIGSELTIHPGAVERAELLLGWASDPIEARALISKWREEGGAKTQLSWVQSSWDHRLGKLEVVLRDPLMGAMVNRWLPYQALSARVFGRTGLYQAGGAFGFRDQLQDMLGLIHIDPQMVREHLIVCAQHQFEEGDVMHWWHPERTGVRTRISDDLLFLPYVLSQYVRETGDASILGEQIPYLSAPELSEDQHDCYQTPPVSELTESMHQHCLRAIRRACRFGEHGLPLMGGGDWNDGMSAVGLEGRGESVWLGEFLAHVADEYAELCGEESERGELRTLSAQLRYALEEHGWDGEWYRRAYYDDGSPMGSAGQDPRDGCRIDAIAQSWAVIAGLNRQRAECAMDQVWEQLVDKDLGIIKLLTPPFDQPLHKPGYIMAYPPGVRENGGQYTHGACWVVAAYALLGQAERAWATYRMLMPFNHSDSLEQAETYRVEPYVVAADVYSGDGYAGRGGWTWYTGAASWLTRVMIRYLLGFERRGARARMRALLPEGQEAATIRLRVGASLYTLTSKKGQQSVSLDGKPQPTEDIELIDDGRKHIALFPARGEGETLVLCPKPRQGG